MTDLADQRAREEALAPGAWKPRFLEAYGRLGNLSAAARVAGISRQRVYQARDEDESFRLALVDAKEEAADLLYQEARRRATVGRDEPVYYKGQVVGQVHRYSDFLLWKLLVAARPQEFSEKLRVEQTGRDGGPMRVVVDDERLNRDIERLLEELGLGG